jgi:hypothetical protein
VQAVNILPSNEEKTQVIQKLCIPFATCILEQSKLKGEEMDLNQLIEAFSKLTTIFVTLEPA